jgi:hypothetical protein
MSDEHWPQRPLSESLIGTWELLSREDRTVAGDRRIDPSLGENPIALLVYDRAGHFAAQFMRRDRSAAPETMATIGAPNNTAARDGYDAYFGEYTVDDVRGAVTQRLVGALSRDNVGHVLTRAMTVNGDELTIRVDTASASGEPIVRTLKWRRIG